MNSIRFLFVLLFLSALAFGQYVGPEERSLHFRVYGNDSKPIDLKKGEYKYIPANKKIKEENMPRVINTLTVNDISTLVEDFSLGFSIINKGDTMNVQSSFDVPYLSFKKGNYFFPDGYAGMYKIQFNKTSLKNPQEDFIVKERNEAEKNYLKAKTVLSGYQFLCLSKSKTSSALFLLAEDSKQNRSHLLKSNDKGITWKEIEYPADSTTQHIKDLDALTDDKIYLITEDHLHKKTIAYKTIDGGKTWSPDILLSAEIPLQLFFVNETTGYAALKSADPVSKEDLNRTFFLYKTTDAGLHWKQIQEYKGRAELRIAGFDETGNGIILAPSGKKTDRLFSNNGGENFIFIEAESSPYYVYTSGSFFFSRNKKSFFGTGTNINVYPTGIITETDYSINGLAPFSAIDFYDEKKGAIVNENYLLLTDDGGKSWKYRPYRSTKENYRNHTLLNRFTPQDFIFIEPKKILLMTIDAIQTVELDE